MLALQCSTAVRRATTAEVVAWLFVLAPILALPAAAVGQEVQHPVPEYRLRPDAIHQRVDLRALQRGEEFALGPPSGELGVLEGREAEVFGSITDVAMTPNGLIYVLDRMSRNIRIFTGGLRHLQTVGREGPGPGEFRDPRAIVILRTEELWAFDYDGRVNVYSLDPAGLLEFRRTFVLSGYNVQDACAIGSNVYVLGFSVHPNDPFVVRKLSDTGVEVASFGQFYDSGNPLLDRTLGTGALACVESDGVVVVASAPQLAEIRGYNTDGSTRWIADLMGLNAPTLTTFNGLRRVRIPEDGRYSVVEAITPFPGGMLVVSIGWRRRRGDARIQSVWLNSRSGRGERSSWNLPLLGAHAGDHVLGVYATPFPRIVMFDLLADLGTIRPR